jgi:hypothetical protein
MNKVISIKNIILLLLIVITVVILINGLNIYEGYSGTETNYTANKNGTPVKNITTPNMNSVYGSNGIAKNGYDANGNAIISFDASGNPIIGTNPNGTPKLGTPISKSKASIPQLQPVGEIKGFNSDGTPIFDNYVAPGAASAPVPATKTSINSNITGLVLETEGNKYPGRYIWNKDDNGKCPGGFVTADNLMCTNICDTGYNDGNKCTIQQSCVGGPSLQQSVKQPSELNLINHSELQNLLQLFSSASPNLLSTLSPTPNSASGGLQGNSLSVVKTYNF